MYRKLVLAVDRGNDLDPSAADVAERHGDQPAHWWESPLVNVSIWAVALCTTALTLWYSLGPAPPGHGSDMELHAIAYFVNTLAILLAVVSRPGRRAGRFKARPMPVAMALLALGGLVEIVQGAVVGRDPQFADWVADAAGITLAVLVFAALQLAPGGGSKR